MNFSDILDPKFIVTTLGLVGVVVAIFAESGLLIGFFLPGDSLLFTAGLFASKGYLDLSLLLILGLIAAILGDSTGYAFGKKVGQAFFNKEESWFFNKKRVEQAQKFYSKHGKKALILARFVPIVRTFAPILAGVGKMEYSVFLKYNVIGAFIWVVGVTMAGFILGSFIPDIDKYLLPIIVLIILTSFIPPIFHIIKEKRAIK
jgi:membrane-associated protein